MAQSQTTEETKADAIDEQKANIMEKDCLPVVSKEIVELHEFFVKWFNGSISQNDKSSEFEIFKARFHAKFMMDTPTEKGLDCQTVMKWIESAYESEVDAGFDIIIKNVKILDKNNKEDNGKICSLIKSSKNIDISDQDLIFAEYEEWQEYENKTKNTVRMSHVAFKSKANNTPNGIQWRALRECWL